MSPAGPELLLLIDQAQALYLEYLREHMQELRPLMGRLMLLRATRHNGRLLTPERLDAYAETFVAVHGVIEELSHRTLQQQRMLLTLKALQAHGLMGTPTR